MPWPIVAVLLMISGSTSEAYLNDILQNNIHMELDDATQKINEIIKEGIKDNLQRQAQGGFRQAQDRLLDKVRIFIQKAKVKYVGVMKKAAKIGINIKECTHTELEIIESKFLKIQADMKSCYSNIGKDISGDLKAINDELAKTRKYFDQLRLRATSNNFIQLLILNIQIINDKERRIRSAQMKIEKSLKNINKKFFKCNQLLSEAETMIRRAPQIGKHIATCITDHIVRTQGSHKRPTKAPPLNETNTMTERPSTSTTQRSVTTDSMQTTSLITTTMKPSTLSSFGVSQSPGKTSKPTRKKHRKPNAKPTTDNTPMKVHDQQVNGTKKSTRKPHRRRVSTTQKPEMGFNGTVVAPGKSPLGTSSKKPHKKHKRRPKSTTETPKTTITTTETLAAPTTTAKTTTVATTTPIPRDQGKKLTKVTDSPLDKFPRTTELPEKSTTPFYYPEFVGKWQNSSDSITYDDNTGDPDSITGTIEFESPDIDFDSNE